MSSTPYIQSDREVDTSPSDGWVMVWAAREGDRAWQLQDEVAKGVLAVWPMPGLVDLPRFCTIDVGNHWLLISLRV